MNILQILPEMNVGGVETGTLDLAKRLVELGHKAVVVSAGGELVRELESCGGIHYQVPVHGKNIFAILKVVPELVRIIKREEIDIVHARSRSPAWAAYWASRKTNRIFITTCHGYYSKHIFSGVMGWGKKVIVSSNVLARHMIDNFRVPHQRIRLIPRSVDLTKFKYSDPQLKRRQEFNIGIIARLTPIKGHLDFIKAMAKVSRVYPDLKIWIVGDTPASRRGYKEQIEVMVRRLGLEKITQFLGTQREIPDILGNLDLLVLATTTQEAFGRVIIEAQAAGVPTVATKVGGVVDIIEDGENGLLVPPADSAGMSKAVLKIINDPAFAKKLADCAYQKVRENYSLKLMVERTLEVYRQALEERSILLIKFSSVGDLILSTAAIRAIRKKFSRNSKISFLVGEKAKEVLLGCPYIDELIVCDFKNKDWGPGGLWRLGRELRRRNFDLVIDLQNNRKSHLLAGLTLSLNRYGYANRKFGFLLNHGIPDKLPAIDPVSHQFEMLKSLGIDLEDARLELWPTLKDQQYIEEFLQSQWTGKNQRIVGINISASPRWTTKSWMPDSLALFSQELSRRKLLIVITGTKDDLGQATALINAAKTATIINACGKTTLGQLACLIKKCACFVTGDSAPLHIAAAVDTPLVALFGPTDPRRHLPKVKKCILLNKRLPCSPCYRTHCKTKSCMRQISVEEVLGAVDKLLEI